jgi:hypothetical protein
MSDEKLLVWVGAGSVADGFCPCAKRASDVHTVAMPLFLIQFYLNLSVLVFRYIVTVTKSVVKLTL